MISIVFLKRKSHVYKIHKDYLLKRNIYFQSELLKLGIKPSGFLIESNLGFQYTDNTVLPKDTPITLITDSTLSISELENIKSFLNSSKIEVLSCVISENQIGNKTILHPCLDNLENIPNWYKNCKINFKKYTIPGYSCFTLDSITTSFRRLKKQYPNETFRLKYGNGTSGVDHHRLRDECDLANVLVKINQFQELCNVGASIEIDLENTKTYGITKIKILNKEITTIGKQSFKNNVYIGSEIVTERREEEKALLKIHEGLFKLILPFSEQLNRFNIDVVIGQLTDGSIIKGVTDLSLKPGAATVLELKKLITGLDTGVYQIYSTKPIKIENQELLTSFLKNNEMELSVLSKYIITINYPLSKKHLLLSPKFKNLEAEIKKIDYSKNKLFSPEKI